MRPKGKVMAIGSVLTLGVLTLGAAVFSVAFAPGPALGTSRLHGQGRHALGTSCAPSTPPMHASAVSVSATGKVRWTTALPTNEQNSNDNVEPVVVGGLAYFAQGGTVRAIQTSDGRSRWSWTAGQNVYGMWARPGVLAVLTDQVSDHAQLTGLDERTGAARWVHSIPGSGLLGTPQVTADGGLAWLRADGTLQVIDLAQGRVRWSLAANRQAVPVTSGGLVLAGWNGVLHAFGDETGHKRWTAPGLSVAQSDQIEAGLVLVSSAVDGPSYPTALTAIDPETGKVVWRFDVGTAVTVLSAGPAGLAVATYVPNRRLYLLDSVTGTVLWQADTAITLDTLPLVLSHDIVSVEGGVVGYPGIRLVDRDASNGQLRWQVDLSGQPTGTQEVLRSGSQVVIEASNPAGRSLLFAYARSTGQPVWRALLPQFVQIPPVPSRGALLVQVSPPDYACAL